MYKREKINDLLKWKLSEYRKPLVLRGARQVGKTTLVNQFAENFNQYIYLNLENQEDRKIFQHRNSIHDLVQALFFIKDKNTENTDTLIFIDEIQEMPEAIASLRYFYEEYPQYYVIAAGSLLETVFDTNIPFPVGRVEYQFLYPFSFEEFLAACGEQQALKQLNSIPIADFAYDKLLQLFHTYTLIGGMPEIVRRYVEKRDLSQLKNVYESLLLSYIDDIEKYARNATQTQIMRHAITSCFREAGIRIRFHGFGESGYGSREMGEALRTLEKAKLIHLMYPTTQTKLPYQPNLKKSPRLQVLDTGLVNYFAGIQKEVFSSLDLLDVYNGKIIEHIVGQELIATNKDLINMPLFWVREKEGSSAELDFLVRTADDAIPVEVKSGKAGKLKSLHQYIEMSGAKLAIRLYSGKFQVDKLQTQSGKNFTLLSIPYFLAGKILNYITEYQCSQ
jgi:predicted AAA+ superfamily ATPase